MNEAAIDIRGVTKTFGPKVAVRNLDLSVPRGSVCAFLGPNGAGKTTTIRMVMSIIFPDSGDIRVLGRASAVESKDRIGYLPEERGLYRKMKVGAFLSYMGRLKGVSEKDLAFRVPKWLDRVGLRDCERKRCEELSKGMQQKVQFVATVLHEPDLIILDEPFSGLDPVNALLLRELIDEQHRAGRTIIFSTHVMEHAEQLCDRVFMIHRGVKVLDDTMAGIRSRFVPHTLIVEPIEGDASSVARAIGGVISTVRAGAGYELRLDERADMQDALRAACAAAPMRRVELKRDSLQDIFIQLVTAAGGDASPATEDPQPAGAANGRAR